MLYNNEHLKLNRAERRRQEKLAQKERVGVKVVECDYKDEFIPLMKIPLTPPRVEISNVDIELEDGSLVKGVKMHFLNCDFKMAQCIAFFLLDFVNLNAHIFKFARNVTNIEKNKDFFDIVLVNYNNIDHSSFERMIDDFIKIKLNFEVIE